MSQSPASSLEFSQIPACARNHGTGLSVWITASLSLSSSRLDVHCPCWAKLWVWIAAKTEKWQLLSPQSSKQGWRCVLGTVLWADLWREPSYNCVWFREDVDTASTDWQEAAQWSHWHWDSTDPTMAAAPRSHTQKVVAVLPSLGGCSTVWTGTRQRDFSVSTAGWSCEKVLCIKSHQLNLPKHSPQCRGTFFTGEHTGHSPGKWSTIHRVNCRAPLTYSFCACICNFFTLILSIWSFIRAQDFIYKLIHVWGQNSQISSWFRCSP